MPKHHPFRMREYCDKKWNNPKQIFFFCGCRFRFFSSCLSTFQFNSETYRIDLEWHPDLFHHLRVALARWSIDSNASNRWCHNYQLMAMTYRWLVEQCAYVAVVRFDNRIAWPAIGCVSLISSFPPSYCKEIHKISDFWCRILGQIRMLMELTIPFHTLTRLHRYRIR